MIIVAWKLIFNAGDDSWRWAKSYQPFDGVNISTIVLLSVSLQPFTCEECGKSLKTKTSYDTHMRLHSGLKPYSCDICGKKFTQKGNLRSHQETHEDQRKYKCEFCEMAFNRLLLILPMVQEWPLVLEQSWVQEGSKKDLRSMKDHDIVFKKDYGLKTYQGYKKDYGSKKDSKS